MSSPTEHRGGAWRSRWAAIGAAVAVAMGAGGIGISQAVTSSGEKPIYLPIEPCRLADTRPAPNTVGPRSTPIGADETYTIDGWGAVGNCNLPTGTAGLSLNVTAVGATQQTNLRFFPAGTPVPTAANLNPTPGAPPTPNAVNVDLDGSGRFSVYNRFGSVAVVIDVVGIYDDHNHDDRYYTESEVDGLIAGLGGDDYENVIVVAKSGGHFASVTAAMGAIGTDPDFPAASASNRYLVWVAPGIYENEDIDMKPFVDIEGSGQGVTVLRSVGGAGGITPNAATLVGADDAELRDITIEIESANSTNWTHAIYTASSTSFRNVTAVSSGGSRARGMLIDTGGDPLLKDVVLRATDASASNLAMDLFGGTAVVDGLFAEASGGTEATGVFVNTAADEVLLENVTTQAFGATSLLHGLKTNESSVTVQGLRSIVNGSATSAYSVQCDDPGRTMRILDATIYAETDGGSARGVNVVNCHLEMRDVVLDAVSATGIATGVRHLQSAIGQTADVAISHLETRAASSGASAIGLQMVTSGGTAGGTFGRVTELNARATGGSSSFNSWAINHTAVGEVQYRGMSLNVGGVGNFLYGIQASGDGLPRFDDVVIDAIGEAAATVFGAELLADFSELTNARVKALNVATGDGHDAVGIKANSATGVSFSDVTSYAEAETGAWGVDITGSDATRLVRVDARAVGIPGSATYGARCTAGSIEIEDSVLRAESAPTSYGLYAFGDCAGTVRGSTLAGVSGTIRTLQTADVKVVQSRLDGAAGSSGSATDIQECTAVTYNSGGPETFQATTSDPCP